MKCRSLFSGKSKKNIQVCCLVNLLIKVVKVNKVNEHLKIFTYLQMLKHSEEVKCTDLQQATWSI